MAYSLRTRIAGLHRDERGLSTIEFAAMAPVLAFMVMGIIDLSAGFAQRFALQQAVNRTIEIAQIGTVYDDYSFLEAKAAAAAGVPAEQVELRQWAVCDGGDDVGFHETCEEEGASTVVPPVARYVELDVRKFYDPLFSSVGYPNRQADGTVELQAKVALRVQ